MLPRSVLRELIEGPLVVVVVVVAGAVAVVHDDDVRGAYDSSPASGATVVVGIVAPEYGCSGTAAGGVPEAATAAAYGGGTP